MRDDLYHEGSRREFLELASQVDTPAFIRRGLYVEETVKDLIAVCDGQRTDMLEFPRLRLATLAAMVGENWAVLHPIIGQESAAYLKRLFESWRPELRVPVAMTESTRKLQRAVKELANSFEKFNSNWLKYTAAVSLTEVNFAREQYNKYYVTEKAAAFQSERLGEEGFQKIPPYEPAELLAALPCLDIPKVI